MYIYIYILDRERDIYRYIVQQQTSNSKITTIKQHIKKKHQGNNNININTMIYIYMP